MAADKLHSRGQPIPRQAADPTLGAARISHHRPGGQVIAERFQHPENVLDRRCQNHQVAIAQRPQAVQLEGIDSSHFARTAQACGVPAQAEHAGAGRSPLDTHSERAPDEPHPPDPHPFE